jgi:hypothetical protein
LRLQFRKINCLILKKKTLWENILKGLLGLGVETEWGQAQYTIPIGVLVYIENGNYTGLLHGLMMP